MQIVTSWMEEGIVKGRLEGRQEEGFNMVRRQLVRKLGPLPEGVRSRLQTLSLPQIESLSEALLDFTTLQDLETWLTRQSEQVSQVLRQLDFRFGPLAAETSAEVQALPPELVAELAEVEINSKDELAAWLRTHPLENPADSLN